MSGELGALWVTVEARSGKFMRDMKAVEQRFEQTIKASEKIGKSMQKMGIGLTAVGAGMAAGLGFAIKRASDLQETTSKFDTVFKDVSKEANKFASELRDNYGMSDAASKKLLSSTGDLLTGFGFTGKAALSLAEKTNKLAVDLASFSNFAGGAEGASEALTKALLGETESAKALGIVIRQDSEEFKTLVDGFMEAEGTTLQQAKAMAVLEISTRQSKNAIGDFARTQGSFANQSRIAKARIDDIVAAIGVNLIPIATKAVGKITQIAGTIGKWIRDNQKLFATLTKVAAGVAVLAVGFGTLLTVLGTLLVMAPAIGAALTVMMGPVGVVIVGIGLLIAAGIALIKHWDWVKMATLQAWEKIKQAVLINVLLMLTALTEFLSWVPGFGDKLLDATSFIQDKLTESERNFQTNKSNFQQQQAAKQLAKQKANGKKVVAADKKEKEALILTDREMRKSLSASWAKFIANNKKLTVDWYSEIETLSGAFQTSLSSGFVVMFEGIGEGWKTFADVVNTITSSLREAVIQQMSDMAAQWVVKHLIMSAATRGWALLEIAWSKAVAAAKIIAGWASVPFIGAAIGIAAAAVAVAAIAGFAKFQDGGVVGGSSFSGDNVIARVNSGEAILNSRQQANTLMAIANGGGKGGGATTVETGDIVIQGDVDGNNIDRIAGQLREAVKSGTIEALSMAKTISRAGNARTSEAV